MHVAEFPASGERGVHFHEITSDDRARVSGPGLRTFRNVSNRWGLTEKQRIGVLGDPARSTYHQWMRKADMRMPLTLPLDTLLRISGVLGIHKSLAILFHDHTQALTWLRGPHRGTVFQGSAPLEFIIDRGQDGILTVRRYLDAWRGGHTGHGAPEGTFVPVAEDDVVFT